GPPNHHRTGGRNHYPRECWRRPHPECRGRLPNSLCRDSPCVTGFRFPWVGASLIDCIVANNNADFGGGLFNNNGTVTITHTTFDGNDAQFSGGGLSNGLLLGIVEGDTVTIANSTFVHNISDGGGGLSNFNMGTMP